jgi:hypothetical protein
VMGVELSSPFLSAWQDRGCLITKNKTSQMMGWKILVPFRTTKVCSPNWVPDKYNFMRNFNILFNWSSSKVLNSDAGGQRSYSAC